MSNLLEDEKIIRIQLYLSWLGSPSLGAGDLHKFPVVASGFVPLDWNRFGVLYQNKGSTNHGVIKAGEDL